MESTYTPVQYIYQEIIQEEIQRKRRGKVFYFNAAQEVDSLEGTVVELREVTGEGWFIVMEPHAMIRIDRIITLFGKPGAAYDEYDAFANACMDCSGGD